MTHKHENSPSATLGLLKKNAAEIRDDKQLQARVSHTTLQEQENSPSNGLTHSPKIPPDSVQK
jgi:hypothetical protein